MTTDGDVVVPLDAEAFGFWLPRHSGAVLLALAGRHVLEGKRD